MDFACLHFCGIYNFCIIYIFCLFLVTLYYRIPCFPYITYLSFSISIYCVSWTPYIPYFSFIAFSPFVSFFSNSPFIPVYIPSFHIFTISPKFFLHSLQSILPSSGPAELSYISTSVLQPIPPGKIFSSEKLDQASTRLSD